MLRQLIVRLAALRRHRAVASLPERLRRDIGIASDEFVPARTAGMIHALDPALLRHLRDPDATVDAEETEAPDRAEPRLRNWCGPGGVAAAARTPA